MTPVTAPSTTETHVPIDVLELTVYATEVCGYLHRVIDLVPEPAVTGPTDSGPTHAKVSGSPAPWNDNAAGLYLEIHAHTRRHTQALQAALFGVHRRYGSSDALTRRLLLDLPDLAAVADERQVVPRVVARLTRDLTSWPRRCRQLLDDDPEPGEARYTRAPGGLVCAYCARRLILKPGWEHQYAPSLWCLRCPGRPGEDVEYVASTWLGLLQDPPGA